MVEDSELVSFRPRDSEVYFEALNDMAEDGYFNGNFSEGVRSALPGYTGDYNFPKQDFNLYVEARKIAGDSNARKEILDEKVFSNAVIDMLEKGDIDGLTMLAELYQTEKR